MGNMIDRTETLLAINNGLAPDEAGLYRRGVEYAKSVIERMPSADVFQEPMVRAEIQKAYHQGYLDGAVFEITKGEGKKCKK